MTLSLWEETVAAARSWYVRLHDDQVQLAEHQDFAQWLSRHPLHRQAWDEVAASMTKLDRDLADLAPLLKRRYALPASVQPAARRLGAQRAAAGRAGSCTVGRRQMLRIAASAGAVLLGAGAIGLGNPAWFADYRSGRGEQRQVTLADGSRAEIGAEAAMSVHFTARRRQVTLLQGDAFFSVAADAARPFVVEAGGGAIEALGTQFSVRAWDSAVDVAVTEHAVTVAIPGRQARRLEAGQGIRFSGDQLGDVAAVDLATAEAWRDGHMAFINQPLRDVVQEIARYRHGSIFITDPALANLRVSGLFRADQPDAALRVIADNLALRVDDYAGIVTLIRPAA